MENVILVIHMILALCLIGVVLLQRSEGGGLGIGGGGGVVTGRAAATALAKLTWIFAIAFIVTSLTLTVIAARNAAGDSVIERVGTEAPAETAPAPAPAPLGGGSLTPNASDEAPATPPKASEKGPSTRACFLGVLFHSILRMSAGHHPPNPIYLESRDALVAGGINIL